ncbi:MAG: hypothetical protein Ct9H300mP32_4580 [Verrucomicrobiota bacterium]|nr:MAG: hypothetical protein Ct9H300mP32_4580 [Verrucomicrobiota bacterium]
MGPAWIDFQNSCVVPLGINPDRQNFTRRSPDSKPQPTQNQCGACTPSSHDFMRNRLGNTPGRYKLFTKKDLRANHRGSLFHENILFFCISTALITLPLY